MSRVHLASEIMGKSAGEALNVITQGAEGLELAKEDLRSEGLFLSPEDVAQMHEAEEASLRVGEAWKGLARTAAIELGPAIKQGMGDVSKAIHDLTAGWKEFEQGGGFHSLMDGKGFGQPGSGTRSFLKMLQLNVVPGGFVDRMLPADHAPHGEMPGIEGDAKTTSIDMRGPVPLINGRDTHHVASPEIERARSEAREKEDKEHDKGSDAEWEEMNRERAERFDQAQHIREQNDPHEKYRADMSRLSGLHAEGLLNDDEFATAGGKAADALQHGLAEKDPLKHLKDDAKHMLDAAMPNVDRFKEKIDEIQKMRDAGIINDDQQQQLAGFEADNFRKAEGVKPDDEEKHGGGQGQRAGAFEYGSKEAYSQILRAGDSQQDTPAARRTAENTAKANEVNSRILEVLSQINARKPQGPMAIAP